MEKTILVTGKDTFLGNEVLKAFTGGEFKLAATMSPRLDMKGQWEEKDRLYVVPWNRRTSLGSRNLVLEVLRNLGSLDEAWVVYAPEPDTRSPGEITPQEAEEKMDQGLKGFFHLLRELDSYAQTNPKFSLNLVIFHEMSQGLGALSALLYSGFTGLAKSVVQGARSYSARGFESSGQSSEGFLEFLRDQGFPGKTPAGRWNVYSDKKGIFPGGTKAGSQ